MKAKRIISLLLAVMMMVAVIPAGIISVSAANASQTTTGINVILDENSWIIENAQPAKSTWSTADGKNFTTTVYYHSWYGNSTMPLSQASTATSAVAYDLSGGFKFTYTANIANNGDKVTYGDHRYVAFGDAIKFNVNMANGKYTLTAGGKDYTLDISEDRFNKANTTFSIVYKNCKVSVYSEALGGIVTFSDGTTEVAVDAAALEGAKVVLYKGWGLHTAEAGTTPATVDVYTNISLETIPEPVAPTFEGVQEGKVDDVFSVRFVATVKDLNYSEVGFKITAMDGEKSWTNRTHTVYSKLIGNTDTGVVEYTKENLDGEYIYALTIKGVPTTGTVTFNVKTYGIVDGIELEGRTYAVTYTDGEFVSVERVISYEKQTYKMSKIVDKVKVIGRSMMTTDGISCDWGASGIEFNAYCKGDVEVNIINNKGTSGYEYNEDSYFSVFLDGKLVAEDVKAAGTSSNVVILKNLEQGLHNIKILKQNEALNNCTAIKSITLEGEVSDNKPQDKELYIECLGDSIFSGYGVLRSDRGGHSDDTSGLYAYGYLTAQKFGADCSLMSVSGIAFAKGFRKYTMPQIYKYTSYLRSQTEEYSFERIPDLVLINLGSNDIFNNAPLEDFKEGVRNLVNQIQEKYGKDIKIVASAGLMGSGNISYIAEVFAEFGGEAAGLYTYSELPNDTSGGGAHPTKAGHAEAAERVSRFISSKLGWEIVG